MKKNLYFKFEKGMDALQEESFMLSSSCNYLYLEHNLFPPFTMAVVLFVTDPRGQIRLQKQLGYSSCGMGIGNKAERTSLGGLPGEIYRGRWKVQLYVFRGYLEDMPDDVKLQMELVVSDEEKELKEVLGNQIWVNEGFQYDQLKKNEIKAAACGWYKGDFHTHTQLSDGEELPSGANEKAKIMNLDFYMATEHNLLHTAWPDTDILVMPGVEVTTSQGHGNLFGLDKYPENLREFFVCEDKESIYKNLEILLREARQRNWLFSMNHPFLHMWKWLYDDFSLDQLSCLEIVNDPTYAADPAAGAEEANKKAVVLADLLWLDGYRICAVGGSDSHKKMDDFYPGAGEPSIPGDPATCLYMDGLSENNVLDALKNCRCYVTRHCDVKVSIKGLDEKLKPVKDIWFGENLSEEIAGIEVEIGLYGPEKPPELFYYLNGKRHLPALNREGAGYHAAFTCPLNGDGYLCFRLGAESKEGDFLFYANPITRGEKEPFFHTFGEIKGYLEEKWQSKEFYLTRMGQ